MVSFSHRPDLEKMDSIALPLALFVLAAYLQSWRLVLMPVVCVGASVAAAFSIMYPIAIYWQISSFAPSISMSLVIAMSIDYSLFMFSRYRECITRCVSCCHLLFVLPNCVHGCGWPRCHRINALVVLPIFFCPI